MRSFQAHIYLEENDSKQLICCSLMIECNTGAQLQSNITKVIQDFVNLKEYHFKSYRVEEYKNGKVSQL